MNLRVLGGYDPTHVCELQLHHRDIFTIKHSKGHQLYSVVRSLGCLDKVFFDFFHLVLYVLLSLYISSR